MATLRRTQECGLEGGGVGASRAVAPVEMVTLSCQNCGMTFQQERTAETAHCRRCGNAWDWRALHRVRAKRGA